MAHILGVTLILGAIICAVTGFNNNIPALAGGGMLLVLFFFCIHGKKRHSDKLWNWVHHFPRGIDRAFRNRRNLCFGEPNGAFFFQCRGYL